MTIITILFLVALILSGVALVPKYTYPLIPIATFLLSLALFVTNYRGG